MKFTELNEVQKAKAIENYRNINTDEGFDDCELDDFSTLMAEYGFSNIKISYDTSFCQGSGASFTTEYINLQDYINKTEQQEKYKSLLEFIKDSELTGKVVRLTHHYNHSNTVMADFENLYCIDSTPEQDKLIEEFGKELTEFLRTECDKFHRAMETMVLNLNSDEAVQDAIIANDYDFEIKDPEVTYL